VACADAFTGPFTKSIISSMPLALLFGPFGLFYTRIKLHPLKNQTLG
jgi:hypothetical protein